MGNLLVEKAMNDAQLSKKYPKTKFNDEDQREILEYFISHGQLTAEKEAHYRETFANGTRVYVNGPKVIVALARDGKEFDPKAYSAADGDYIEESNKDWDWYICRLRGKGWFVVMPDDVAEFKALLDAQRADLLD